MPPKLDRDIHSGYVCTGCAKKFTRQRDGARHLKVCLPPPPPQPSPLPNDVDEISESVNGGGQDGSDPWDGSCSGDFGDGPVFRDEDDDAGIGEPHLRQFFFFFHLLCCLSA